MKFLSSKATRHIPEATQKAGSIEYLKSSPWGGQRIWCIVKSSCSPGKPDPDPDTAFYENRYDQINSRLTITAAFPPPLSMQNARASHRKLLKISITAGLLLLAVGCTFLPGYGLISFALFACALATFLWWFTLAPPPKDELPSSKVSCCHYLDDQDKNV